MNQKGDIINVTRQGSVEKWMADHGLETSQLRSGGPFGVVLLWYGPILAFGDIPGVELIFLSGFNAEIVAALCVPLAPKVRRCAICFRRSCPLASVRVRERQEPRSARHARRS